MKDIKLGFACIHEGLKAKGIKFQHMNVSQYKENELLPRIRNNFRTTYLILEECVKQNIFLYRFSSNLVPLATHELNTIKWWKDQEVLKYCKLIREICNKHNIQTSFHPDQFTMLSSPRQEVLDKSLEDLTYHYKLCKLLDCKLILLHIGGVYGDKGKTMDRFIKVFKRLPMELQELLYFENDDKSYNIEEVLDLCEKINRVIVPDWHHSRCLPSSKPFSHYINRILKTWSNSPLEPKLHLSSSKEGIIDRRHADFVTMDDYNKCLENSKGMFNLMMECKKKELAILQIRNNLHKSVDN